MFLDSITPLHTATAAARPLITDRRLKLVPATPGGYRLPGFYHWLLLPFSKRPVRVAQHRRPLAAHVCPQKMLL